MKVFKMISVWLVLLGLSGYGKENEGNTSSAGSPFSVAVESAVLIREPRELLLPGEVRPVYEVSVAVRVSGIVRRLDLVSVDSFSEGDLLVELDSEELSA